MSMDNKERALSGQAALDAYLSFKGEGRSRTPYRYEITDLICDLLHLGDLYNLPTESFFDRAMLHYEGEIEEALLSNNLTQTFKKGASL